MTNVNGRYTQIANIQKDKIMNMSIVNNSVSMEFYSDNFLGLLTKGGKTGFWDLLMKRNQQIANKANTVLLQ